MSGGVGSEAEMTFPEAIPECAGTSGSGWLHRARSQTCTHHRRPRPAIRGGSRGLLKSLARIAVPPRAAGGGRGGAGRGLRRRCPAVSGKSLQLTWVSVCGLLTLLLGAKVMGLYDRDDVLLHKTTLDEAPKLFQVATLGALVAWLAGGFVINGDRLAAARRYCCGWR